MSFDKLSYHKGDALNLPKGWEIKKLGEVCELSAGGDVPKDYFSEMQTEKFQIPIYANGEKNEGLYGYTTIAKIVKPSITVSARGTIGFSVKRLEPFFPIVRLIVVSPIDLKKLSLDFLDYALRKIDFKHSGSSIPQLTVPMIRDYEIPLPPLPEQQRIVSILDACFSVIERSRNNAEQNLKNAKALFESYLQGVFENGDWEMKTLNQISENLDRKRKPITKNKRDSGNIPYYGASGIVDYVADYLFDENLLCVSEDGANLLARTYPIAFSISGKTWVNNHAHVLKFPNLITQKFVEVYINSIKIDDFVSGMAQPKLNQAMLNKIPIPFPSLEEQQTIVRQLDALRAETQKLEAVYQKKLNDLDEMKKSILQKAFAGELRSGEAVELKTEKALGV